ncbi:MAG: L,D-transpeptidase [Anaerolineales bacterium]|jgi:lipoprotein-anchoring transpeptidase ErfK/SrfK|nr:L,D-transpeptidase [Chloroflexota bacterium]MBK6645252.1 L,D-transpeptidase [Anaerolineales bacterium]MCC6986688.1 L,D-transpeptidase [Anaerolineales bacterium]
MNSLSRRDFLKIGGLALGGLAFTPFLPGLTDFDDSFVVRIGTANMPVRKEPSDESRIELSRYRDELVHVYGEVTAQEPEHNPVWYRVWGGYLHRGRLHRVRTIYHTPIESIPAGSRLVADISVPFTNPWRYSKALGWQIMSPPLYYGSVHFIDAIEQGPPGADYAGPWYRIFDELDSNVTYYVPAIHMRVLPADSLSPISPDVPYEQKLIEINLSTQMLYAYEYGSIVFQTNISSGVPGDPTGGAGIPTTTPTGKFTILDKVPAKHMGYSYFGEQTSGNVLADVDNYVLPGVPWTSFFTTQGHAFHGTYWHENFGSPMSHGCINMRTNESNWLFRWTSPAPLAPTTEKVATRGLGTKVEIHY